MSQPSFYAIIPAHVRYSKELEPNAKLLYGEITALASQEGYCWASNNYFADLYGVDISTIQVWIKSLKTAKFIKVELIKEGIQTTRKIWISPEIQNMFTRPEKSGDPTLKIRPPHLKNQAHINTLINTDINTLERGRGGGEGDENATPPPLFEMGSVRMEKKDYDDLVGQYGEAAIDDYVERLDLFSKTNPKRFKEYSCHKSVVRQWLKKDNMRRVLPITQETSRPFQAFEKQDSQKKESKVVEIPKEMQINQKNFTLADKICVKNRKWQMNGDLFLCEEYLGFPKLGIKLYFDDENFEEMLWKTMDEQHMSYEGIREKIAR